MCRAVVLMKCTLRNEEVGRFAQVLFFVSYSSSLLSFIEASAPPRDLMRLCLKANKCERGAKEDSREKDESWSRKKE
jgi:hypothetical protein